MQLSKRQQEVLDLVRAQGFVTVEALAEHFDVTPQTIRRDFNALCDSGLLRRHHGGAGLPSSAENLAYTTRQVLQREEKERIAALAARQIPDYASLFINLGTTNEAFARALRSHRGLRVITNNLNVATELCDYPGFEVIVAGGQVRARDRGVTGEATIDLIRQFRVDFGVIGVSGIEPDGTLLDFDYHEVRVSEAIIGNSRQVFLLADHTKFGRNAMVRLGHIAQVHALFTDAPVPEALRRVLAEAGTQVHIAAAD